MKKNRASRSAFFNSRALVIFAVCAIAVFVTLLASALYPGGNALAQPQQQQQEQVAPEQSSMPAIPQENLFHGQVVSIREMPMSNFSPYDLATMTGQNPLPLSPVVPENAKVGTDPVEARPIAPDQATPSPTPAGAVVLLDTFNGRSVNFTSSVPRTYMGDGFTNNTLAGGTTYVSIRSYTFYMVAAIVANYTDIHARLALWNNYNAAVSPVFSNNNSFFDVDLGPVNVTAAPVFFAVTVTVLPPFPFFLGGSGSPWGYSQNFQDSTTGGAVADDTNLTSTICNGAAFPAGTITTGTSPTFGYYRNASGETDFNFQSTDSRALTGLTFQGVGIIIRGDPGTGPTPTPAGTPFPTPTPGTPAPTPTPSPSITPPATVCTNQEGFDDITNLVNPKGWIMTNHSTVVGSTGWFQGSTAVFTAQAGASTDSYIGANFNNDGGPGTDTISNWLLSPPLTLQNGGWIIFSTRTVDTPAFPDRLQIRISTNGTSSNVGVGPTQVGDFTTLLLDINPTYLLTGAGSYPNVWTMFKVQITGLGLPIKGRIACRYFVENGGPAGVNSDYIGIDTFSYTCSGPTPTPAQTPTPTATPTITPTPQPTGTPSPTCQPVITLSSSQTGTPGSVSCNNGVGHADNSYWRAFNMNGFTGGLPYSVTSVSFGIESATAGVPGAGTPTPTPGTLTQPVTVRLYTQNPGPAFPGGTKTQIATTTVQVANQTATIFTTPLVVTVPAATSELIMEVFTPNGEVAGNTLFIGSNSAIEGGPSYLSAADCGITTPTTTQALGFPNMHIILDVNGSCVTNTPTPTPITISGTVGNCASPAPTASPTPPGATATPATVPPVPNVLMTLSGSASGTTLTSGAGTYSFAGLSGGGSYTVTPSKGPVPPAGAGINNVDVLAIQRHFLGIAIIPAGCRLNAADCAGTVGVNNQDVLAVQRFFLGFTSGTGSVGQYRFSPTSHSYPADGVVQDFKMWVLGDAGSPFVNRPGEVVPDVPTTVGSVLLPAVAADQSKGDFTAAVKTSTINATDNLVGFQGDFTFDERVVSFDAEPVQAAGLTAGNWTVAGNVLPGQGPMRTLRLLGYSNDFAPLSGTGVLFELKVTHVESAAGTTPLMWSAPPDNFIFINADLQTQRPGNTAPGSVGPPNKR